MNNIFGSENEILKFLQENKIPFNDFKTIQSLCCYNYKSKKIRNSVSEAFSTYLTKYERGHHVSLLADIASFLAANDYVNSRFIIQKHLHALKADIEVTKKEYPGMKVTNDALRGLEALKYADEVLFRSKSDANDSSEAFDYDIFLSYSAKDTEIAELLSGKIIEYGLKPFIAKKNLQAGDMFSDKIRNALINSSELWILLSPDSLRSEWVTTEWGAAWVLTKKIVPILHRCSPEQLPERLKNIQCCDYYEIEKILKQKTA